MLIVDEFMALVQKHLHNKLTTEEQKRLDEIIMNSPAFRSEFEFLTDEERVAKEVIDYSESVEIWKDKGGEVIAIPGINFQRGKTVKLWYYLAAAAILAVVSLVIFRKEPDKTNFPTAQIQPVEQILAGSLKATLTLSDNRRIELNPGKKNTIQDQHTIIINDGEQLDYRKVTNGTSSNAFNVLTTPVGGYYKLRLPDGSLVWLNAVSSLKFPVQFTGKERRVELEGEAYFEVVKNDRQPFIVVTEQSTIKVLGTKFNIKSYTDEKDEYTTLLEGSVQLGFYAKTVLLKPNQQAILDYSSQSIRLDEVDAQHSIGWTNGLFTFRRAKMNDVFKQLERWYGVSFVYTQDLVRLAKPIDGGMERSLSLSEALTILKDITQIDFHIDGRKIIVSKAMN